MSNATEVIEVNVNLNAETGPLHGSLRLGRDEPRNFRGWPELANLIAAAPEHAVPAAGHAHNVTPLELALSTGSPSTVTIRCYVADPDVG